MLKFVVRAWILLIALQFSLFATSQLLAGEKTDAAAPAASAPVEGQRVFICGHSFHVYIAKPLEELAKAAGIKNHSNAGVQFIGGSSVTQHWDLADEKNKCKQALKAGKIDVLTLSPNWIIPDPAIDRFVDLALQQNPNTRIVMQLSWPAFDSGNLSNVILRNEERDKKTVEQLQQTSEPMRLLIEKQARAINEKHGKQVLFLVPVAQAVFALRDKVIRGEAPGVAKQSDLFTDSLGHGKEHIQRLAAYCSFAAIYHRSPVGLTVFEKPGDENWNKLNRILQQLAWDAVTQYPLSGVHDTK